MVRGEFSKLTNRALRKRAIASSVSGSVVSRVGGKMPSSSRRSSWLPTGWLSTGLGAIALGSLVGFGGGQAAAITQIQPQLQSPETGSSPTTIQLAQTGTAVLYVNASGGNDASPGTANAPLRTISRALQQATPGTVIRLAPGTYSPETGEAMPLRVGPGVTLEGSPSDFGRSVQITGGGNFVSRSFARQNAAIVFENNGGLSGVTVINPNTRGSGVWVESGGPRIANNTFIQSHRDGVFVSGDARPTVERNVFSQNGGNGLSITRAAQGLIQSNRFENTGFGLAIGGSAAPVVIGNEIVNNNDGIVISDRARPSIRNNTITGNRRDGVVAISDAQPDLGNSAEPGGNRIRGNGRHDIYNATRGNTISAVGNDLDNTRVQGAVVSLVPGQLQRAIAHLPRIR